MRSLLLQVYFLDQFHGFGESLRDPPEAILIWSFGFSRDLHFR